MNFNISTYSEPKNDFLGKKQLHLNENLLEANIGYIKRNVVDVIKDDINIINKYPQLGSNLIKNSIGDFFNVQESNIFVDNGSSNIIRKIFIKYMDVKGSVLLPNPSWSFYNKTLEFLEQNSHYYNLVKNESGNFFYEISLIEEEILKNNTKMIVICSPNNPTGNRISISDIIFLINKYKDIIFVLDQAYYGFVNYEEDDEILSLINNNLNVYIIRTVSKFYGLANLRVGFLFSHNSNIKSLENLNTVFGVCSLSQKIIKDRLNRGYLDEEIRIEFSNVKNYLIECNKLLRNFKIIESCANFILVEINIDNCDVYSYLLAKGFVVKIESIFNKSYIRLTIADIKSMKDFVKNLLALDSEV